MAYKIDEIEGIGPTFATKLGEAGIKNTDDLLTKAGAAGGRKELAGTTGLSETNILKWVNMADMMRISGVGGEYAELLHAAGVDTVAELKGRNATNLADTMVEVNSEKKLTRTVPSASVITGWIEQAQGLDAKISH